MKQPKPYWKMYVGVTAHISSGLRLAYSRLTLRPNRSGSESIVEITCGICYVGDQKHGFFVKPKMTESKNALGFHVDPIGRRVRNSDAWLL